MKKIIGLVLTVILLLGLTVSAGAVYQDEIRVYTPDKPFAQYQEAPELKVKVALGELPPVAERLPDIPPVVVPREEIGKYGGMMRTYQRSEKIFNWVTNIVREGLLRYDSQRSYIYPNLAKDYKVSQDETEVTVYLHKGVKWSDGHLLTVDDFIFAFDSYLAYHPDKENLEPAQYIQPKYLVGEEPLEFEKIDDYTMILRTPQAVLGWWEKVLLDNAYSPPLLPFPAHVLKELHPM